MDVEYVIYETPHPPDTGQPCENELDTACPGTEKPDVDNPCLEKYLPAALCNAPTSIDSYYVPPVNHHLHGVKNKLAAH